MDDMYISAKEDQFEWGVINGINSHCKTMQEGLNGVNKARIYAASYGGFQPKGKQKLERGRLIIQINWEVSGVTAKQERG